MYTFTFPFDEVRWGILGVGNVCEVKSAPAMQVIPGSKLVAVMRRNGAMARDYALRHGVPAWYDEADALINDPNVNAVYIAAPPDAHLELTRKAASARKPVYVEKPMARTSEECLEMVSVCKKAGVPLYVAYYRRCLPNFLKMKELIDTGVIGEVRFVQITMCKPITAGNTTGWRVDPKRAGGGHFFDLASHQLDYLDYVLGPVTDAVGFSANQAGLYAAEDIVTGSFRFASGALGAGSWCFTTAGVSQTDRTVIVGSAGEIEYQTFGNANFVVRTDALGEKQFHFEYPKHIQQPLITSIVNELLGHGECPSTGITGMRTNAVMEKIINA